MRSSTRAFLALLCFSIASLASCGRDQRRAILWTDSPELSQYVEVFNASQDKWRVEAVWRQNPAEALKDAKELPALVAGRWLKSSRIRGRFRPLDKLFTDLRISRGSFYPRVLAMGKMDGRQLLLPLSFNLPAVVFPAATQVPGGADFSISLDELRDSGRAFNKTGGGAFTRMGFSPRWDPEFLYLAARLHGADFHEGKPFSWDEARLEESVEALRLWVREANDSAEAEDEFQFKYLYDPGYRSVAAGRILYSYIDSDALFLLPDDKRSALDYRWVSQGGAVPVLEGNVFLGACRGASGQKAADAFISWLFQEETQKSLLEAARADRTLEKSFGIASGFSSLKQVNERVFLSFYPALVGHLPQEDSLQAPAVQGAQWPVLRDRVVIPWLQEAASQPAGTSLAGDSGLETALASWLKENPE